MNYRQRCRAGCTYVLHLISRRICFIPVTQSISNPFAVLVIPVYVDTGTIVIGAIRSRIRKVIGRTGQKASKVDMTPLNLTVETCRFFLLLKKHATHELPYLFPPCFKSVLSISATSAYSRHTLKCSVPIQFIAVRGQELPVYFAPRASTMFD